MKLPEDAKTLAEQLPAIMPDLFRAWDAIGRVHYSRFTLLSEKTLLILGDFDGEFGSLMAEMAGQAGAVLDSIFAHVANPPTTPVADHADEFLEWAADHLAHPLNVYTAYPGVTAQEVKALAARADVSGSTEQRPFLVILPTKSRLAFIEVQLLLRARAGGITWDLDSVGTPHLRNSCRLRTTRSDSSPSTMAPSTPTSPTSPGTSGTSSTSSSSSPRGPRPRRAGSISRNSSTSPRARAAPDRLLSGVPQTDRSGRPRPRR